jgi:hypothetical protein
MLPGSQPSIPSCKAAGCISSYQQSQPLSSPRHRQSRPKFCHCTSSAGVPNLFWRSSDAAQTLLYLACSFRYRDTSPCEFSLAHRLQKKDFHLQYSKVLRTVTCTRTRVASRFPPARLCLPPSVFAGAIPLFFLPPPPTKFLPSHPPYYKP